MTTIRVLIATHNRKDKSIRCLEALRAQSGLPREIAIRISVLDDGSTDGTVDAIRNSGLVDELHVGDGSLYWCRAMRRLSDQSVYPSDTHVLYMNDDTILYPGAVSMLLGTAGMRQNGARSAIVVGAICDTERLYTTYGGLLRQNWWHPLRFVAADPGGAPRPVQTFNANCVMLPREVLEQLGGLGRTFTHSFGDLDLGLRAGRAGVQMLLTPAYVGECDRHPPAAKPRLLAQRWRDLNSPKGLPPYEHYVFCRSHGGYIWFAIWFVTLLRRLLPSHPGRDQ